MQKLAVVGTAWCLLALGLTSHAADYFDESAVVPTDSTEAEYSVSDACGNDCCSSYCSRCGGCDVRKFFGIWSSDRAFDDFISPISNPFFFEDPRSLTEARGIFIENSLPMPGGEGGGLQVYALQLRARISDRLSVIAPRIADMDLHIPDSENPNPNGMLSAPIGLKYNLVRDPCSQFLVSAGTTYFIPGQKRIFSGFGDGDFHFFLTGGKRIFGYGHWLSGTGFRIPVDSFYGTQLWYWSNQWDYELPGRFYPLFGINWYHWMRSATNGGFGGDVAGLDLVNLPATGVAGDNVVTSVIGMRWKPRGRIEIGGGWEFPLTDRRDVLRNRVYADLILRY